MEKLTNLNQVNLLTYEENPRKRRNNQEISFYSKVDVVEGQEIIAFPSSDSVSKYTITEIKRKQLRNIYGNKYHFKVVCDHKRILNKVA